MLRVFFLFRPPPRSWCRVDVADLARTAVLISRTSIPLRRSGPSKYRRHGPNFGLSPPSRPGNATWVESCVHLRSRNGPRNRTASALKGHDRAQVAGKAAENAGPESGQLYRWVTARPHPVLRDWPGSPSPRPDRPLNRQKGGRPSLQAHRAGRRECHRRLALGRGETGRGGRPAAGPATTAG